MRYLIQIKKGSDPHWQTLTMVDDHGDALIGEATALAQADVRSTRVIPLGRYVEPAPRIPHNWAMPQVAL